MLVKKAQIEEMKRNTKVTLAFKKGFYKKGKGDWWPWFESIIGFGIMLRTVSVFVHEEVKFSCGYSWSSSESKDRIGKGGKLCSGIGFKKIQYSHPERWEFVEWDVTDKRYGKAYKNEYDLWVSCNKMAGEYDFWGIAGHALGIPSLNGAKEYYCSEACSYQQGFNPSQLSPGQACQKNKDIQNT